MRVLKLVVQSVCSMKHRRGYRADSLFAGCRMAEQNLGKLSDAELEQITLTAAVDEREATTHLLKCLIEIEKRRIYAHRATSMFEYCIKVLGMSEGHAGRRVSAARLMMQMPEIESSIRSGELSLTNASLAQNFFRKEARADRPVRWSTKSRSLSNLNLSPLEMLRKS